jgi:hypothetical protein
MNPATATTPALAARLPDEIRQRRLADLITALATGSPTVRVRTNRNRRLLVSLRADRGAATLSIHEDLLDHEAALVDLVAWVRRGGRGRHPQLRAAMAVVFAGQRLQEGVDAPPLPPVAVRGSEPVDLPALFARIHATWFAHVPIPAVEWSRGRGVARRQRHIRFGCYRRHPRPLVTVHPRLDQAWVATCFIEHVLFHELCHHAQACKPLRGEAMHGRRFREWERRYPHHALALAWERVHLHHFLDGTAPVSRA